MLTLMSGLTIHVAAADVTIVSSIDVTGLPVSTSNAAVSDFPLTVTTFFQGEKSRLEVSDGSVYLFDADKNTVYQIDSKFHTYRTESIQDLESFKSSLPKEQQGSVSVNSDLNSADPGDAATYLSTKTSSVALAGDAHVTVSRSSSSGRRRHGGGGGGLGGIFGGGIPGMPYGGGGYGRGGGGGDDSGGGGAPNGNTRFPSYNLLGTLWISPTYQLPKEKHSIVAPIALQLMWGGSPMLGDLVKKLDNLHELPLHSEITVTQTFADPDGNNSDTSPSNNIKTTFDVQSVSYRDVDPTLFDIPAGYAKDDTAVYLPQLALPVNPAGTKSGVPQN